MFTEMEIAGPEITENDLNSLELELELSLPKDYRRFLAKYNGGEPVEKLIDFSAEKISQSGDYVALFYEISNDVSYGILKNIRNHGHLLPENIIYIANTPAGNYFLLSLRDDSYGEVYYKDHEFEDALPFDPKNGFLPESIVKVADNFDEFLCRLYDPDEE